MTIHELIAEAKDKSPVFKRKYDYWLNVKRAKPDLDWLMSQLEDALGVQYVRDAAQRHLDDLYGVPEEAEEESSQG